MDPVTHVAAARLAIALNRRTEAAAGLWFPVVAALAPDVDALLMPIGWDIYLRVHQAGTHSVAGALALSACLGALGRRRTGQSFGVLFAVAAVATLSHVALDTLSGATIRLAWPFASDPAGAGLVAMSDPWFVAPVLGAWIVAALWRRGISDVAYVALIGLAVLLVGKGVSRWSAERIFAAKQHAISSRHVEAQWGSLTGWWIYGRSGDRLQTWSVDAWTGRIDLHMDVPAAAAEAVNAEGATLPAVGNFLRVHDLPLRVEVRRGKFRRILWSDLRYCWSPAQGTGPAAGSNLRPSLEPIVCTVWFGADLDAEGLAHTRLITIGDYVQERQRRQRE